MHVWISRKRIKEPDQETGPGGFILESQLKFFTETKNTQY